MADIAVLYTSLNDNLIVLDIDNQILMIAEETQPSTLVRNKQ